MCTCVSACSSIQFSICIFSNRKSISYDLMLSSSSIGCEYFGMINRQRKWHFRDCFYHSESLFFGKSRVNKKMWWVRIYVLAPQGVVAPRKMDLTLICRDRLAGRVLVTWPFLSLWVTRQKERARPIHHQTGTNPLEFSFLICNLLYNYTACCVRPLCEKETDSRQQTSFYSQQTGISI